MTFPTYADLVGHNFDDIDGNGLTHRHWMANVGASLKQASAHISGSPIAGGYQHCVLLIPGGTSQQNIVAGTLPPWNYSAGHIFMLEFDVPAFSTGTLSTHYIEMDVVSTNGTNAKAVGVDAPISLSSSEQVDPVIFDDFSEAAGAGSDLSMWGGDLGPPVIPANTGVVTAAGGVYVVSFFIQFDVSADFS